MFELVFIYTLSFSTMNFELSILSLWRECEKKLIPLQVNLSVGKTVYRILIFLHTYTTIILANKYDKIAKIIVLILDIRTKLKTNI